jgi:hypothetical protein
LKVANGYDTESIKALTELDNNTIFHLNPTHNFDSPPALYTLTSLMNNLSATKSAVISHSNSAILANDSSIPSTTSYFTMYFLP